MSTPIGQLPAPGRSLAGAVQTVPDDADSAVHDLLQQLNAEAAAASEASLAASQPQLHAQEQAPPAALHHAAAMASHVTAGIVPADVGLVAHMWRMFAPDVKLALMVFALVVCAHNVPLDAFLARYFAVERIPYHNVMLTAAFVAVGAFIGKRLMLT